MAGDYPELTRTRLRDLLRRLQEGVFTARTPLQLTAFEVRGEPIPYPEAIRGEYRPISPGERWGPPWSTTWFHVRGHAPAGPRPVALVDLGYTAHTGFTCEALAWRDGRAWRGVDPNHRWLPLDEGEVDLYLEAAANPGATVGGPGRAASQIDARSSTEPAFAFEGVEAALLDEEARALYLDFKVLLELDRPAAWSALTRFADDGDREELARVLALHNGGGQHRITALGHAHIDTAWLWPVREARRKVARSWSSQVALMDEYPEHRFAASQAAQYQWVKESHPELYESIGRLAAEGRWEPVGAMWVEADCNLPSGESLVRQVLQGQRFWQREFGRTSTIGWLPDGFGFPASLPQILAGAGCRYFLTQKLSWNQVNQMPHHTFWWEGLDGTRLLTHFPPSDTYNGLFDVTEVAGSARRFRDHGRSDRSLYLFGWGDGGGGPEADHLELAHRLRDLDGVPRVELGLAEEFFSSIEAKSRDLADWVGELYFELHRGTYTSQARVKRLNRLAEESLRAAELWSVALGPEYPAAELDTAWKTLLVNQFHDILPGSSIDWVYEQAERELRDVIERADRLADRALGAGTTPAWFNATGHARSEVVEVDGDLAVVEVPPCGFSTVTRGGGQVEASEHHLENEVLRVEWDSDGLLTSVFDKEHDREALAAGARGNVLRLHRDEPALWDAWDLDPWYEASFDEIRGLQAVRVMSSGLRGAVGMTRTFGASSLDQRLVLDSGARVLRLETAVDWRERHRALRAVFPVSIRAAQATYEIQFGHVERPTHRNTSWDVARFEACAHRWVDLGEPGYGVALLNDSKYGHGVHRNEMAITLLRSPLHPDPTADQGAQRFTYALMPHGGDFRQAGVIEAAEDLNSPLRRGTTAIEQGGAVSFFELGSPQVSVAAVKRAEDSDGVIVRLYEAWGGSVATELRTALPVRRAVATDLLERETGELPVRDGVVQLTLRPFQILTLKLEE